MERARPVLSRIELGTLVASALAAAFGLAYAGAQPHLLGSFFGLAPSQTVRVNITNVGDPNIRNFPPDPCMVQFKFFDADGSVVVQSEFLKILPGASISHDLKYADLKRTTFASAIDNVNRAQLRVSSYLSSADAAGAKIESKIEGCSAATVKLYKMSIEVFDDTTGKTTFMVPAESALPSQ